MRDARQAARQMREVRAAQKAQVVRQRTFNGTLDGNAKSVLPMVGSRESGGYGKAAPATPLQVASGETICVAATSRDESGRLIWSKHPGPLQAGFGTFSDGDVVMVTGGQSAYYDLHIERLLLAADGGATVTVTAGDLTRTVAVPSSDASDTLVPQTVALGLLPARTEVSVTVSTSIVSARVTLQLVDLPQRAVPDAAAFDTSWSHSTGGSVPIPSATEPGDLLFAVVYNRGSGAAVTHTLPSGWTVLGSDGAGSILSSRMTAAYKVAGASEPALVWTASTFVEGSRHGAILRLGGGGTVKGSAVFRAINSGGPSSQVSRTLTAGQRGLLVGLSFADSRTGWRDQGDVVNLVAPPGGVVIGDGIPDGTANASRWGTGTVVEAPSATAYTAEGGQNTGTDAMEWCGLFATVDL